MGNVLRYLKLVFVVAIFGTLFTGITAKAADSEEEILVGRIAHVEGRLLRYIAQEKDWVLTVSDAPFGLEDTLYSGIDSKAEFIMPNRTWLRVGENTQIQLIDLYPDATTVDLASGLARLYNKSEDAVIKVTTPFGYIVAPADTIIDLYVGDESVEIIAVRGSADFVHNGSEARYVIWEGESSIIADVNNVTRGDSAVDSEWDDWNIARDDIWAQRLQIGQNSAGFLPEPLRDEAYALEENGQWERVYYEGTHHNMWRPVRVDREWRPFTAGRWTVYYGDNCWIPDESFGYVTHHYGSWVYIDSYRAWYWIPPAPRYVRDAPRSFVSVGWYPGRVGWIHNDSSIGWVPLAPEEEYYGYRSWGHRTVVVKPTTVINITTVRYRYVDEAVIIPRDQFYRGKRYTPHVRRNVDRDVIINNYRPVTVINNTVINNFNSNERRFTYNDEKVSRKPHATVMRRIDDNQRSSRKYGRINRERIDRDLTRLDTRSEPPPRRDVRRPMLTTKIVDVEKVSQPINTLSLQKKEIKPKERDRRISADTEQRRRPRDQEKVEKSRDAVRQDEEKRVRSQRDARSEESEREIRQPGQAPKSVDKQRIQDPKIDRQQQESQRRQEVQGMQRRQTEEVQKRQDRQQPSVEKLKPPEGRQKIQKPVQLDKKPEIESTKDKKRQEVNQRGVRQEQIRQQEEVQLQKEQQVERQKQQGRQRQQELEQQQRQADEVKNRQDQQRKAADKERVKPEERKKVQKPAELDARTEIDSTNERKNQEVRQRALRDEQLRQQQQNQLKNEQKIKGQQQEENQRLQKQESLQRQNQEVQQQQNREVQQRQKQEVQQRQNQEAQQRQKQEVQQRQDQEVQQRQDQEVQQRQKQEVQQRQKQEVQQRQKQEVQQRQNQEVQQRQQQEVQQRQRQEVQRQKQERKEVQPRQVKQRQQQGEVSGPQEQQSAEKKKRTPEEQKAWELQQIEVQNQQKGKPNPKQ